jgi:hypothetical protein
VEQIPTVPHAMMFFSMILHKVRPRSATCICHGWERKININWLSAPKHKSDRKLHKLQSDIKWDYQFHTMISNSLNMVLLASAKKKPEYLLIFQTTGVTKMWEITSLTSLATWYVQCLSGYNYQVNNVDLPLPIIENRIYTFHNS